MACRYRTLTRRWYHVVLLSVILYVILVVIGKSPPSSQNEAHSSIVSTQSAPQLSLLSDKEGTDTYDSNDDEFKEFLDAVDTEMQNGKIPLKHPDAPVKTPLKAMANSSRPQVILAYKIRTPRTGILGQVNLGRGRLLQLEELQKSNNPIKIRKVFKPVDQELHKNADVWPRRGVKTVYHKTINGNRRETWNNLKLIKTTPPSMEKFFSQIRGENWVPKTNFRRRNCKENDKIVYIKTHKTASSTTSNIIYRYALHHNIPMLLYTAMPYPFTNLTAYVLHTQPLLRVKHARTIKFKIAAEHIRYERQELRKVMMPGAAHVTSLRHPLPQLKSLFNYFGMTKQLGIKSTIEDPVLHYIYHHKKYSTPRPNGAYRLANRMANMLGMPERYQNDSRAIRQFISRLSRQLSLVMISEHQLESVVMLRRLMCWSLRDVIYESINQRNYVNKNQAYSPDVMTEHRKWNLADYMLYDHFNRTLWQKIHNEGPDFHDEVNWMRRYMTEVFSYCDNVYTIMRRNASMVYFLHKWHIPLTLPASRWSDSFTIDVVWCLLQKIDIMPFANILRVKQYPQICYHLSGDLASVKYFTFRLDNRKRQISMLPVYCYNNNHNTSVPLSVLATDMVYMWA